MMNLNKMYKIACNNTVAPDGTVLDNAAPAPPELIVQLERQTGIKAPPEAARWSLTEVNLFFASSGTIRPSPAS